MKKQKYSYWWPVNPPKGFESWKPRPDIHNQWILWQGEPGQSGIRASLSRKVRHKLIRFRITVSPKMSRELNPAPPSARAGGFAQIQSAWMTGPQLVAWWTTQILIGPDKEGDNK